MYKGSLLDTAAEILEKPLTTTQESEDLTLSTLDDFEEKEVQWLIKGYVPKGCITILAGTGGVGKSSIWASLLSSLSSGKPTIFEGNYGMPREPTRVMFFTTEDAISEVVKGKLRKNGAVMKNVITMNPTDERFKKIIIGSKFFESLIAKYRPSVCLIDPLQSFIDKNVRMAERNAMRQALESLLRWGMEYGTTFIILAHTNKQSGVYGRQRISDSADLWDIARSVLMLGETGEDGLKYISHEKSNYGRLSRTVLYNIVDSVPVFQEFSDKRDRDFIQEETKKRNSHFTDMVQECSNVILSELASAEEKKIPVQDIDGLLKSMGYSDRNIRDAKKGLKESKFIDIRKDGFAGIWHIVRTK